MNTRGTLYSICRNMKKIFFHLLENVRTCFSLRYIPWHVLAIISTVVIVETGFDWKYYLLFRNSNLQVYLFPAVVIGGLLPLCIPIILYAYGKVKKNLVYVWSAYAIAEAAFLGSLISSFYKALTGRVQPPHFGELVQDISHGFQFGFFRHGIFWGWPSSHTTIAFAIAVTVCILFQKEKFLRYFALCIALYIGLGVSISIHWFSDFVAGAIVGSVIGVVVGNSFLNIFSEITKSSHDA